MGIEDVRMFPNGFLVSELDKLSIQSSESVADGDSEQDKFNDYLHVEREIQVEFYNKLLSLKDLNSPQLILLTGSVGDGKSHLLSYMKSKVPSLMSDFKIHSDATESWDVDLDAYDTLNEVLRPFMDENIDNPKNTSKQIIAINWGILSNFIENNKFNNKFSRLKGLLEDFDAFNPNSLIKDVTIEFLTIINFSDYQLFELTDEGVNSVFIDRLLQKITYPSDKNPFYNAYMKDKENNIENSVIHNYEMFLIEDVQKTFSQILIKHIIKHKKFISTRELLNCIHDVLVPSKIKKFNKDNIERNLDELFPYLIFNRLHNSSILKDLSMLSPYNLRNKELDKLLISLNTFDIEVIVEDYFDNVKEIEFYKKFLLENKFISKKFVKSSLLYFIYFFGNDSTKKCFEDKYYELFIKYLFDFNDNPNRLMKPLVTPIKTAIFRWKGSNRKNYIIVDNLNNFIISKRVKLDLYFDKPIEFNSINKFYLEILAKCRVNDEIKTLNIDYRLFEMIFKINEGYRPNKKEKSDLVVLNSFINQILKIKNESLLAFHKKDNKFFEIYKDDKFITFGEEY